MCETHPNVMLSAPKIPLWWIHNNYWMHSIIIIIIILSSLTFIYAMPHYYWTAIEHRDLELIHLEGQLHLNAASTGCPQLYVPIPHKLDHWGDGKECQIPEPRCQHQTCRSRWCKYWKYHRWGRSGGKRNKFLNSNIGPKTNVVTFCEQLSDTLNIFRPHIFKQHIQKFLYLKA